MVGVEIKLLNTRIYKVKINVLSKAKILRDCDNKITNTTNGFSRINDKCCILSHKFMLSCLSLIVGLPDSGFLYV